MQSKTYIIGDIHGCYHTMIALLEKLPKDARIIFVGDLCDRGNFSKEVIEFISSNNYECVLGNHDYYMATSILDTLLGKETIWSKYDNMGYDATLQSYGDDRTTIKRHIAWIETLPQYIEIDHYFISHAFALPYYKRRHEKSSFHPIMINRTSSKERYGHDWEEGYETYPIINIFGHDNHDEVVVGQNYYGIDTGCVYGGKLTALALGSMESVQQSLLAIDTI